MLKIRKLLLAAFALVLTLASAAQVTTSSITGTVKDKNGAALEGATITATHTPTGAVYTTLSKRGGVFVIPNARIGGPYKLRIEYVGQKAYEIEGFNLQLGEPFDVKVDMSDDVRQISEVVVTGGSRKAAVERTGASTSVNQRLLTTIPTINRSLADFTRLTPQANGNSFAGRDARLNNTQIDGANLNNNFGLNNDPLPGGANQPISLDVIEEISVNVSPFDVWQGNFTGAGINVVTKSGTNNFKGSAYGLYRDESFNGRRVASTKLPEQSQRSNRVLGGTVGGPIIKDKLFFFLGGEYELETRPGITWTPTGGSGANNISRVPVADLQAVSDTLRRRFGYETGRFDNFRNFETKNYKVFGRLDWNISKVHKATFRYNEMVGTNDIITNATSMPNNPNYAVPGGTGTRTNLPQSRFSRFAMSYENSIYAFENTIRTGAFELNSSKGGKWANQFLTTFTINRQTRTTPSTLFPFVDIFDNAGNNYISFGREPFSNNNDVDNRIFNVTNNFKYFAGRHTLTFGVNYEQQFVGNMFMPGSQSYYAFRSVQDFFNNAAPVAYTYTYSLQPDKTDANGGVYSAQLRIGQLAGYIQDDINVSDKLKVTLGLRVDAPIYLEQPVENPLIKAFTFPDANGNPTNYSTGRWPRSTPIFSPRVGFRWDAYGDKSLIVRGGAGIFTGRFPFVFLTNMPSNSQMYQANVTITDPTRLQNFRFNPNSNAYRDSFPSVAGQVLPPGTQPVLIDPNFKFPQVFRLNLAVDKRLGNGWSVTFEGIFNKDINGIIMRNANQREPDASFSGVDNRPRYSVTGTSNAALALRRIHPVLPSAVVLENTNRGGGIQLTTELRKAFTKGFFASFAYTFTQMFDVTTNPGSTAVSVWNSNPTRTTQNAQELGFSAAAIPHRFIASLGYSFNYLKAATTTVTMFYEGSPQNNFSWIYQNDMNGDGNAVDLMYVPRNPSEIIFVNQTANPSQGLNAFTAQAQSDAFFQFLERSPLRKRKGQYVSRNEAVYPWIHNVNLQVQQDFYVKNKQGRKHTLRIQADVLNFLNMLNRNWGVRFQNFAGGGGNTAPLIFDSVDPVSGQPRYRMQQVGGQLPTTPFQLNRSIASVWGAQLGIRYIF